MKRILVLMLVLMLILPVVYATAKDTADVQDPYKFTIRNAIDSDTDKIALTIDDCYDLEQMKRAIEICKKYGVAVTFFPLGQQIHPEDRELWQSAIDAGCEIGSHAFRHTYLDGIANITILSNLGKTQEALDTALGYHYGIKSMRPPYGSIGASGSADNKRVIAVLRKFGYNHIIRWNVSQTDPKKAMKAIKPGCIALFHTRNKDINCLDTIIPKLLEKGLKPVTVCELLGFDPPEISDEIYVYHKEDYQ